MAFLTQDETKLSSFQRDKERISKRFQTNLEAIIAKYDRPFGESDVLDLNNLTVVEDRGFLSRNKKSRIGTTKLAVDKVSPHKATRWESTKDSTDSAFGSTRLSESDTSGTETLVNYTYQNSTHTNEVETDKAVLGMEDALMSHSSHSEDSGNEDVDTDHSGPICTPKRSTLRHPQGNQDSLNDPIRPNHQRARGNLTKKFENEYQSKEKCERGRFEELSEDDNDEEEEDPYEFKDELPSILEERNRFLFKMQSILADSFSDGDGMDEMDSSSDGDVSTGTVESSEVASGSISAWSTLQSKLTPKRTPKLSQTMDSNDKSRKSETVRLHENEEMLLYGLTITNMDSDYTDCSTILAGNLHTDRQLFHPSNLLSRVNRSKDSTSNMSQPPFEAICNSTMLSEVQPPAFGTAKRKTQLDSKRHRELELPLDGQGEMCLGEVPLNAQYKPKIRSDSSNDHQTKTPKSKRSSEYRTPVKHEDANREVIHTSLKSNTPTTRNHNHQDSESPGGLDVSSVTPRTRMLKAVKLNKKTSLSSPRFDTQEIIEIFRSPKPLIIPGINLDSLDLTPRRRGPGTPTMGPLKNALLRLQSPSSAKEEKSAGLRSHTAKEIIMESNDSACEMTLDCSRYDSESNDDQESETLVCESNVCSDDGPTQIARTPQTAGIIEPTSDRKHQGKVVKTAHVARPEVQKGNQHLAKDMRELKTSPVRKDKSVSKIIHTPTGQARTISSKSLNVAQQQRKRSEDHQTELRVRDSQVRQTVQHHHSSKSTDAPERNTNKNSVCPESDSQRSQASTKHDTGKKYSGHKRSEPRQLTVRSENVTGKKPAQQSRDIPSEDSPRNRFPLSSKTPNVKRSILTPTVQRSPSTLSSPLNRMSLSSPQAHNEPAEDKLTPKSNKKISMEQVVRKKQKKLSEGRPKPRDLVDNVRLSNRGRTSKDFNSTHMTIRDLDDDSEDEMEVDVDPYSLTADDSSPGPSHYHRRRTAHPKGKSTPWNYNDHGDKLNKLTSSQPRANHLSQKFHEHYRDLDKDAKTPTKRHRHPGLSEGYQIDLTSSENDSEFGQSSSVSSKEEKVSANETAVLNRAAPLQVENNPSATLVHGERKLDARFEQTLYVSDEESNSSDDSAKFLSLVPNHSAMKTCDSDPAGAPVAIPRDEQRHHEDRVGSYRIKHKTIIRCGQIISSPKSTKSVARNLHNSSPPRTGRVEKSRKVYTNSPTRLFQSDSKSVRNSTKVNQRGQPAKTVARRLIASPMKKLDNHMNSDSGRASGSSPLCSSGCNVSSSYMCEGPGHCTKPFCFSCALSELS